MEKVLSWIVLVIIYSFQMLTSQVVVKIGVASPNPMIYVDDDNNLGPWDGTLEHPYANITCALEHASANDKIYVFSGVYNEHLYVSKTVSLIGEADSVIDGNFTGTVITVRADKVNVTGFIIQNSGCDLHGDPFYGIDIYERMGCNISYNHIKNTNGISLQWSHNNTIFRNNCTASIIGLVMSNYNIISWNHIADNDYGLIVSESSNNRIVGNNVVNNRQCGLIIGYNSRYNLLRENNIENNYYNFCVYIWDISDLTDDVDASNTVDGKPIIYWVNKQDMTVPLDAGYVVLASCRNITAQNLNIAHNKEGIILFNTTNCVIGYSNITSTSDGIYVRDSSNNLISGNNMTNTYDGIYVRYSSNNVISGNNIMNGYRGIKIRGSGYNKVIANSIMDNWYEGLYFDESNGNTISENNIVDNSEGIHIFKSSNNTFFGNHITRNKWGVRSFWESRNNIVYHNNFLGNGIQAEIWPTSGYSPAWDDGYPSGGNFWSDYEGIDLYNGPYQNLTGSDGIGDTAYVLAENNQDNYPLMIPWVPWDITGPNTWVPEGKCDMRDVALVANLFGSLEGDEKYDIRADITGPTFLIAEGKIDMRDVGLVAKHYGEIYR